MNKKQFLKIFLIFIGIAMVSITGYSAWQISKEIGRSSNDITESVIRFKTKIEDTLPIKEIRVYTPIESDIDTSSWNVYRNEKYGFEIRYPNSYTPRSWDKGLITHSRSILLREYRNNDLTIEVVSSQEEKNLPLLGILDTPYVSYIRNPDRYEKMDSIIVGDKVAPVFFFDEEYPGAFGDWRDTIVTIIELEQGDTFLIIKSSPASDIDAEFEKILSSLHFFK